MPFEGIASTDSATAARCGMSLRPPGAPRPSQARRRPPPASPGDELVQLVDQRRWRRDDASGIRARLLEWAYDQPRARGDERPGRDIPRVKAPLVVGVEAPAG